MQGGAADLASVASPRKSSYLQDFEEAAASLPVSPSSSVPFSPSHSPASQESSADPAAGLPAPFLTLKWIGLGLQAYAVHDKLQQLTLTLVRCAVQRALLAPADDPVSSPDHGVDEVNNLPPPNSGLPSVS